MSNSRKYPYPLRTVIRNLEIPMGRGGRGAGAEKTNLSEEEYKLKWEFCKGLGGGGEVETNPPW